MRLRRGWRLAHKTGDLLLWESCSGRFSQDDGICAARGMLEFDRMIFKKIGDLRCAQGITAGSRQVLVWNDKWQKKNRN